MNAATSTAHRATDRELAHIADLICGYRPGWDPNLVAYILRDASRDVASSDLAVAAIRYAADPKYDTPKGIKWKGPHWRDLATRPVDVQISEQRCDTCGKPESRCITERPGPDDHPFTPTPAPRLAAVR
jgi:hypothetical protein